METVRRLAARVKTRRINQENNPALPRNGNWMVEIRDEHRRKKPTAAITIKRRVLCQFLFSLITVVLTLVGEGSLPLAA
jgi:hypothetical protein